jgi:transcriptional regulator with XRE-family HTH domain
MNDKEIARHIGDQLRAVRLRRGLSLHQVEEKSAGVWRAIVVGSYERGDRNPSAVRLVALAGWYGVPVESLLPGWGGEPTPSQRHEQALPLVGETYRILRESQVTA